MSSRGGGGGGGGSGGGGGEVKYPYTKGFNTSGGGGGGGGGFISSITCGVGMDAPTLPAILFSTPTSVNVVAVMTDLDRHPLYEIPTPSLRVVDHSFHSFSFVFIRFHSFSFVFIRSTEKRRSRVYRGAHV